LIDHGAEDFSAGDGHLQVVTDMTKWTEVRDFVKTKGCTVESVGLQYVPKQTVPLDAAGMTKIDELRSALEEDDDVSEVHVNAVPAA
jgi:transcriptional/translational regulatory protein YebC/TACO1